MADAENTLNPSADNVAKPTPSTYGAGSGPLPVASASIAGDLSTVDPAIVRAGVLAQAHHIADLMNEERGKVPPERAATALAEQALVIRACEHSLMLCRATTMPGALAQLCFIIAKVQAIADDPGAARLLRHDFAAVVVGVRSVILLIEATHGLDRMHAHAGYPSIGAFYCPSSADPAEFVFGGRTNG